MDTIRVQIVDELIEQFSAQYRGEVKSISKANVSSAGKNDNSKKQTLRLIQLIRQSLDKMKTLNEKSIFDLKERLPPAITSINNQNGILFNIHNLME